MKIEAPKKPSREAGKWEEHMQKKAKGPIKGGEAEITHAKKKASVAPTKGKVMIESGQPKAVRSLPTSRSGGHAAVKESAKVEHKQHAKVESKPHAPAHKKEETKHAAKAPVLPAKKNFGAKSAVADIAKDVSIEEQLADLDILKHPLVTEKAVNLIESENKLTFVVAKSASKPTVKSAVESLYKVRVKKVSILNDMKARKRAIVTLHKEFKASDIATKLGVI